MKLEDREPRVEPAKVSETVADSHWFQELYSYLAPVREETASSTEQEIDAAIDAAVRAVRSGHPRRS